MDGNLSMANQIVNQTEEQAGNNEIEYLGYTIRPTTDPWMIKYKMPFEYFRDEQLHGACSIQECKDEIDERLDQEMERLNKEPKS